MAKTTSITMKPDALHEDEKIQDTTQSQANDEDQRPPFSNYWRIVSFGTRIEHGILCIAIAAAAGSGVALPLMNIIFGSLVNNFNTFGGPSNETPEEQFKHMTSRNALFFVYLFIGKFVLTYVAMFCFRAAGLRISASLRLAYLRALFSQPIKKLDQVSSGTVANTITVSTNAIQASISDRLFSLFQSLALVVAAYGVAFKYSWALTLAVSSSILFTVICLAITTPFTLKALHKVTKADEKHAAVVSESLSSIRTVLALGAESKVLQRFGRWVDVSHKGSIKVATWTAVQLTPFYFSIYASYALAFWFGLKLYREGNIAGVNNVIIVFFSVLLVTAVLGQIAQPIMAINQAISASSSFFDIIDSDQVQTGGLRDPDVSSHTDIEIRDVTFAYPARPSVQVLKQFSATIQRGKTTALVGPSGSGKSTIVALLERWYNVSDASQELTNAKAIVEGSSEDDDISSDAKDPPAQPQMIIGGTITVGGTNIEDLDLKWWRSQIGLVQQEPFLFNDTVENNVAYGLIGTPWEDADAAKKLELIKEACVEAFADEFICKLPHGYSTKVGESGIKLSGGQRQRIAIARSIVRKPTILILDEATSAIDVQGEQVVQAALDRASRNRTTIMIAHRLSTIRKADHIIVLRGGQKIEEGTHDDLLSDEDGLYHSLIKAQRIEEEENGPEDAPSREPSAAITPQLTRTSTGLMSADVTIDDHDAAVGATNKEELDSSVQKKKKKTEKESTKSMFSTVGLLLYEQRSRWGLFTMLVFAAMGCGGAYALQSWLFAQLIQAFQYVGQRLVDAANFWSLMFFVLALGVTACYATLAVSSGVVSAHVGAQCRREYFRDALKMPIAYFDREENASGSVMQRVSSDPKQIQDLLGISSAFPLISLFTVVGCVIISFYFGWKLTLVTFFAVMPVIIGASFLRMRYEVQFSTNNSKVFATSSQFATEASGAFRTVSSLGMEDVVIDKYDRLLAEQIRTSTRKASYAMLVYALTDSIELCGMALTFWYGGQLLASGEYSPFQFFVIYSAIVQGSQAAGVYLSLAPNLANATGAATRILQLRGEAQGDSNFQQHEKKESPNTGLGAAVSFHNVTFRYPGLDTPLFTNLNITIQPGQFVAFVGPSGCGKTTVISMLERFYDPDAGTIAVDGEDISTQDRRTYRRKLALVSQEPRLFSGTVKENLLLGLSDDDETDIGTQSDGQGEKGEESESIRDACTAAEIHTFLTSLPEGYGTELGQNTQTTLSGGQKQRLCLARALLRHPNLLLLDEATSSLDSQSEKLVQGAIERLASGERRTMTVIAVAHRLATIQKADVIYVFGERDIERRGKGAGSSRIVEVGSHNELMARRGVYWSMCQAQALDR